MVINIRTVIIEIIIRFSGRGWRELLEHDDGIKWKHFPRYWPFVRGIHRSPVNFPHKGQSRGALMFSLICVWTNNWINNRDGGDLRRHSGHYDVTVMVSQGDIPKVLCHVRAAGSLTQRSRGHQLKTITWREDGVHLRIMKGTLQWRHNERGGFLNHQHHDCLLNRLFKAQIKKKYQSSALLAFVGGGGGNHWWPVNSPHKGLVTRKMSPFDDVIMRFLSVSLIRMELIRRIISSIVISLILSK